MGGLCIDNSTDTSFVPNNFVLKVSDDRTHTFRNWINDLDILSNDEDLSLLYGNKTNRRVYPDRNCVSLRDRRRFHGDLIRNHWILAIKRVEFKN